MQGGDCRGGGGRRQIQEVTEDRGKPCGQLRWPGSAQDPGAGSAQACACIAFAKDPLPSSHKGIWKQVPAQEDCLKDSCKDGGCQKQGTFEEAC